MALPIEILSQIESEVKFVAVRSRGPGGQNVNKVSSAAILLWDFGHSNSLSAFQKEKVSAKLQSSINKENQIFLRSDEFRDLKRIRHAAWRSWRAFWRLLFMFPRPARPHGPLGVQR